MKKTQKEGVVTIFNEQDELIAIIYKDKSRKNVFYSVSEMSLEELEQLVKCDTVRA